MWLKLLTGLRVHDSRREEESSKESEQNWLHGSEDAIAVRWMRRHLLPSYSCWRENLAPLSAENLFHGWALSAHCSLPNKVQLVQSRASNFRFG